MNANQLLKVSSFTAFIKVADDLGNTALGAGLGAGAGAAGGYLHSSLYGMQPAAVQKFQADMARRGKLGELVKEVAEGGGGLKSYLRKNVLAAPSIAKAVPGRIALPALALGGLGALLGSRVKHHEPTAGERLSKLWARRPDLLKR